MSWGLHHGGSARNLAVRGTPSLTCQFPPIVRSMRRVTLIALFSSCLARSAGPPGASAALFQKRGGVVRQLLQLVSLLVSLPSGEITHDLLRAHDPPICPLRAGLPASRRLNFCRRRGVLAEQSGQRSECAATAQPATLALAVPKCCRSVSEDQVEPGELPKRRFAVAGEKMLSTPKAAVINWLQEAKPRSGCVGVVLRRVCGASLRAYCIPPVVKREPVRFQVFVLV